jgi:DNA-binding HxlR family transcriptional regulator
MRKTTFGLRCSVARSLEIIGEWWTPLIVREAFFGTRRFVDFQNNLGIAAGILATRLAKLVEAGVFVHAEPATGAKHMEYQLTEKGKELFPVIVALMQWGDRWETDRHGPPVRIVDKKSLTEVDRIVVRSSRGRILEWEDVEVVIPSKHTNNSKCK